MNSTSFHKHQSDNYSNHLSVPDDKVNELKLNGFTILPQAIPLATIKKISTLANLIYRSDQLLSRVGLGNLSKRNGTVFTGNLLLRSSEFIFLLADLQKTVNLVTMSNDFYVSEYMMVSSNYENDYKEWWHRDFPFTDRNIELYHNHSCGFFLPLFNFDAYHGSTNVKIGTHNISECNHSGFPLCNISAEVGDLVVYDPRIFHTGGPNLSLINRHLIVVIFNRKELIAYENFETQLKLFLGSSKERECLDSINIRRHIGVNSFFGRNRSANYSIFSLIYSVFKKISSLMRIILALIYLIYTRASCYLLGKL